MITVQLHERELRLLIELMQQRITQAERAGLSKNDPSSLFRMNLFKKLADAEPGEIARFPAQKIKIAG